MPSSTSLLPAEVSGASSSQADQPEITVPTLVPGMVAATPSSLDGTKERPKATGRSPEALDWHSCDSSDSMEAAHLQRAQKSQNSTPSHDLVDSRSPQSKRSRTHSPTSRTSFALPVAWLLLTLFLFNCQHSERRFQEILLDYERRVGTWILASSAPLHKHLK